MPESGKKGHATGEEATPGKPECFVLMPISDPEGYPTGHFRRVFEDIFVPACDLAGYSAIRADQIRATNLIHLDVLQRLLNAPIAICDLSSRNPNVLFELGLRQAFDKPVVLVQEAGTPQIFDIAPLRYTEYRRSRLYHEVLEDQRSISEGIIATVGAREREEGVNSLVRILELTQPASLEEVREAGTDPAFQILRAELDELRLEFRQSFRELRGIARETRPSAGSPDDRGILGYLESPTRTDIEKEIESLLSRYPKWFTVDEISALLGLHELMAQATLERMAIRGDVVVRLASGRMFFQVPDVAKKLGLPESRVPENPAGSSSRKLQSQTK